jgi:2-polyprenyl-3-methyl-5-hydroxy-6-metoxy-1,4-benzoquinol methylase
MKRIERDNPFIRECISLIAKASDITYEIAELIFEIGVNVWRDSYHTIEYLLIKSIDSRLSRMAVRKGGSVLNVGCGYPINEIIFSRWGAQKIVGIDADKHVISEGEKILNELKIDNVELYVADALDLDQQFPLRSFDTVVSFSAIEHVNGIEKYENWIRNMSDVAKRHIVLTTSNKNSHIIFLLNRMFRIYNELFLTPKTVKELLVKNNLRVTHFETNTLICYEYLPLPFKLKYNKFPLKLNIFLNEMQRKILKNIGGRMGFVCEKKISPIERNKRMR